MLTNWKPLKQTTFAEWKTPHKAELQAKLRSYNNAPKYMYGFEVPKNYAHAMRLDRDSGNTKWKDAVDTEMMIAQQPMMSPHDFTALATQHQPTVTPQMRRPSSSTLEPQHSDPIGTLQTQPVADSPLSQVTGKETTVD